MALVPWDDIKAQVGYDSLSDQDKIDNINKYSRYVQEYYTNIEPRDPREVGTATDEFVNIAAKDVLGDLGPVERASAFLGNIYKGAAGTFTSAFRSAALAQQVIGERLGSYDDDSPIAELDLYQLAQNIDESVRDTTGIEDPRLRGEFINTLLPQGLGSAFAFLGTAAAAAAAAPASATAAVGLGTAAGLGAASTSGSLYEEAKQYGANEFVARGAAVMGVPIGLTEAIPLGSLASRLTAGLAKRAILGGIVEGGLEEAAQEGFSQVAQNVVASKLAGYDPERPVGQNVLQSAAVGLVTGGLLGGGVNAITRDNEAFYGEAVSRQIDQEASNAARIGEERYQQFMGLARNAGQETVTEADPTTGEQIETTRGVNVFGNTDPIPEVGTDPAVNSVEVARTEDGSRVRYQTPSKNVFQVEYTEGQPVRVTDVTDLHAKETAQALRETDARLLAEAQREVLTGRRAEQVEPTSEMPRVPERDTRGISRQEQLKAEISRLYQLRQDAQARQTLTGQGNEGGVVGDGDPNTARTVTTYGPEGRIQTPQPEVSRQVARLNRMIAVRERELNGLVARPESYIMASKRDVPPTQEQKDLLVQGFRNLFQRLAPGVRSEINFEVGDIQPLIDSGRLPKGAVAYYERASDGRKAMVFLSDKLATTPMAQREILHELGHAFYDTLPSPIQAQLEALWRAETSGRTGPLFDDNGAILPEVSSRVMTIPQEWFSERLAWSNDNWAKGRSEDGVMGRVGSGFRTLLDKFLRYTGHGDRINLEFRAFLNQGDRFARTRQILQAAAPSAGGVGAEGPDELSASVRFKYQKLMDFINTNRGGFTVEPITFRVPERGFVVAPSKRTEDHLPLDLPPEVQKDLFKRYLNAHRPLFTGFEGEAHIGGWLRTTDKEGRQLPLGEQAFVLDVSFVMDNKADALYLADRGQQEAIFDIANGDEIKTAAGISGLQASDVLTPERRGELGRLGGQIDYLSGRPGPIRRAAERLGLRVPGVEQVTAGQPEAAGIQEAGQAEVRASVRGPVSVQSVPLRTEGVRVGERPMVEEVARYLQNRSLEYLQQPLTQSTPADARLSQFLINAWPEVSYQLQQEENGLTWYTEDITQMESDLRQIFPTTMRNKVGQTLFKAILTPLSYGQNPKDETSTAIRVWENAGQSFPLSPRQPNGKGWTRRAEIVEKGFERLNRLVKSMGERGAVNWLLKEHPISELRKYNPNVAGKMNDLARGSMILGPKGGDYFANMNGIYDELTSDLHFNRMWNRMMGTLLDANGEIVEAPRNESERNLQDRAVGDAAQELGLTKSELQAVLWVYEIGLWKDLGARLNYYKHSDGTGIALDNRGIQRRQAVRDSGEVEARRQTALGRADALSRSEGQGQVLPEVRPSVRGGRDQEYLAAVSSGDTATAKKMVDEAAVEAGIYFEHKTRGKLRPFWHYRRSKSDFTTFKIPSWFAKSQDYLEVLMDDYKPSMLEDLEPYYLFPKITEQLGQTNVSILSIPGYDLAKNDWRGRVWISKIPELDGLLDNGKTYPFHNWNADNGVLEQPGVIQALSGKYQLIHLRERNFDTYAVLDPRIIKSADIVTYDNDGEIIPLSQRFNFESDDIRASIREDFQQRVAQPVIALGRRNLRTGGALPYPMFRAIEQQGFNINEKMVRAQNAVDDLESAVKKVTGKNLSQLTDPQIKRLNDALQNPAARASLNPQIAVALGNMRNLLDSLSAELIRSGAIPDNLVPVITANLGVYLHRSYEKWENPKYTNPFNSLPREVQNRLQTIVREYAEKKFANSYAKQQSLARGEESISPESDQYKADYQAGIQQARNGGIDVKAEIDALAQPEADSPFGQLGSVLTKDLSILQARNQIPEEVRLLWGEIKDPRVNFLKSIAKMSGLLETHNMLKNLRDEGMGRIFFPNPRGNFTVKLVTDGSRTASPLNMFVEGMRNDVYTSQEIYDALKDTFGRGAKPETFMEKVTDYYLRLNGFSKFAKTVLSVQTQVRNVIGNGMFLVANGYVFSPDANIAVRTLKQLAIPGAATYLGLGRDANMRNYVAKLTKLGILGQSVYASELESYFRNAQVNTAQDIFDNHFIGAIKTIGRGATKAYQLGDAIPKIIAYEVELARLRRAFPGSPISSLEQRAADKVLNSLPTYSRIPRLGNFLRQQPFVGAFISFPLEVVRTGYNLLSTINEELRSTNPEVRKSGAYRLVGTMMASAGFSAVAGALAYVSGIDDEEDRAIRKLDAPWDRYSTKLYLGRDNKGNIQQVNLSYVDPYNYLRDPIIALAKSDGSWERRFLEAVKTGFEPFFGEQILASKILDISRNKKGTTGGRVYNPEGDVADRSLAIASHMFDAFNLGTIASADRIYKGLTGQVTQTGRAYDPALETLATVTGQRVVTVDSRQALSFAARRFNNRLNDATGIFTAAFYDQSRTTPEARLQAYQDMMSARTKIFGETSDIINASMRLGLTRGEVIRILREQGISQENAQALTVGLVTAYKPRKELRAEVSRYRQQATATR